MYLSHTDEEGPRAFVADGYSFSDYDGQNGSTGASGGLSRKLAWIVGSSMIAMGFLGISSDRLLWIFDTTTIAVGALALPPVTRYVREQVRSFPRSGFVHSMLATMALGGAFALNVSGVIERPATFPALQRVADAGFGEVNLTDPAVLEQRALNAKTEYMGKVQSALDAMTREAELMADLDATPTSYDVQVLNDRAALVALRRSMTLTPEESALVDKLAAKVSAERAAMAPGLRRAYVDELNGPLASYGVTARMIGGDIIEFIGAAMADPQRQNSILALTEKDRLRLGFIGVRFVAATVANAGGPPISAISEPADAPLSAPVSAPLPSSPAPDMPIGPAAALSLPMDGADGPAPGPPA